MPKLFHKNPDKNPLLNGNFVYKITTIEELKEKPGFPFYGEAETADFDRKTRPVFGRLFQEVVEAKKLGPEAAEEEMRNLAFEYRQYGGSDRESMLQFFNKKKSEILNARNKKECTQMLESTKDYLESKARKIFDDLLWKIMEAKNLNPEDAEAERKMLEQKYRKDMESIALFAEKDIQTAMGLGKMFDDVKHKVQSTRELEEENLKLKEALVKAKRHAITDVLSGLYNRRHFYQRIEEEFARTKRDPNYTFSVLMIDIDKFKEINDALGHAGGDEAIKTISKILMETFGRPTDIKCRYGGEEFAVILAGTDNEGAMTVAEKLRRNVQERFKDHMIKKYGTKTNTIMGTASIGVTTFDNQANVEEIIEEADKALYRAKNEGRNQVLNAKETKPGLRIIKGGKEELGPVEKAA